MFPPPEQWTETQYAAYEEPLVAASSQPSSSERSIRVMAVRDSVDLKMHQLVIP